MAKTIATQKANYELVGLYSQNVTIAKATGSAIEAKAGHLVFQDPVSGKWTANAADTSLVPTGSAAALTDPTNGCPVGLLMEDVSIGTGADATARVMLYGTAYVSFVRGAGIDGTNCPDWLLFRYSAIQSGIRFIKLEEV